MRASGQTRIDAQNPWPGLESFDEAAERFFNGRTEEIAELKRLVMQAPLTVLFGMSGLGKTSLLQAGLFPAIRKDNVLPVYVRLDVRSREGPLIDQVAHAFRLEMGRHQVDAPPFEPGESLWCYLHRAGLELWSAQNQLLTPLFVLDQFEEVFTLGADRQQAVAQLRRDLSDLVENRVPAPLAELIRGTDAAGARFFLDGQRYKVLLSFREDFLPPVEGWKLEMPSILRNRLRLLPMSAARAFEAVHDTAPDLVNEALAQRIVDFVAAQERGSAAASLGGPAELKVEPALLSLVCHGLNEKRKERGQAAFDDALLRETGPSIVSDFYTRSVRDVSRAARRFIEEQLITESGFRKQCAVDDARSRHGVADAELALLVDRRLLRIEPWRGIEHVELMHDLLTGIVREVREKTRQRARHRAQSLRLATGVLSVIVVAVTAREIERRKHLSEDKAQQDSVRADIERAARLRYADSLLAFNDELRRGKAAAETLRTLAVLDARRAQAAQLQLDTILKLYTTARVAQAQLEDRERILAARERELDSKETEELSNLRRENAAAARMVMRGAARAAMYQASATFVPFEGYSRGDVFDTRQGAGVLASDSVQFASAMLGQSFVENPERGQQPAFFRDGRPRGYRHWIEWDAQVPTVGSVALFAAHDGRDRLVPSSAAPRSFRRLTILRRDRSGALDTLVDYFPALPYAGLEAYGDQQPLRSLSVCLPTRPTARGSTVAGGRTRFRLELEQGATYGPRVIELDGYAGPECGAASPAILAGLRDSATAAALARRYGSSTVTIARVLERAEPKDTERALLAGALQFLARSARAAWNDALALRAGGFLFERRPSARGSSGAVWRDSLSRLLTAMVPDWRASVARVIIRRQLFEGALSDAQVRDSLVSIASFAGVAVDSDDTLRTWRDELQRLDSLRVQSDRVARDTSELLSDRRRALATYIEARVRSIRQGQGTDGATASRQRDALADGLRGSWAVCSRSLEGHCPVGYRQAFFAAGDSLQASFRPVSGSADSSVTLVVVFRDSVQMRQSVRVAPAPLRGARRSETPATAAWGGMVLREPGRWTLRVYDASNRLVLRYRFTVGVLDSIALGQQVSGVVSDQSPVFNDRPVEFYRWRCTAGQTIRVSVTSQHDNVAMIVGPDGTQVGFNDDAIGTNAQLDWTCPDSSSYSIGAGGYTMAATGAFVLSVQPAERPAARPQAPPPSRRPTSPVGVIALGQQVRGIISAQSTTFEGRPVAFYQFRCTAGQAIRVNVTSEYDNVAVITGGGGLRLAFNDDANGTNAQLEWTCPGNGIYYIGAGAYNSASTGPFVLAVQPIGGPASRPDR